MFETGLHFSVQLAATGLMEYETAKEGRVDKPRIPCDAATVGAIHGGRRAADAGVFMWARYAMFAPQCLSKQVQSCSVGRCRVLYKAYIGPRSPAVCACLGTSA